MESDSPGGKSASSGSWSRTSGASESRSRRSTYGGLLTTRSTARAAVATGSSRSPWWRRSALEPDPRAFRERWRARLRRRPWRGVPRPVSLRGERQRDAAAAGPHVHDHGRAAAQQLSEASTRSSVSGRGTSTSGVTRSSCFQKAWEPTRCCSGLRRVRSRTRPRNPSACGAGPLRARRRASPGPRPGRAATGVRRPNPAIRAGRPQPRAASARSSRRSSLAPSGSASGIVRRRALELLGLVVGDQAGHDLARGRRRARPAAGAA